MKRLIMEKHDRIDFDTTIESLTLQSSRAQCTFFYRLINNLGPSACRSIIRYCYERLDRYNSTLPDEDPNKQKFIELSKQHKTYVKHDYKQFKSGGIFVADPIVKGI